MHTLGSPPIAVTPRPKTDGRFDSIDMLRGLVMILMALDHVRDFFGHVGVNPTDPALTTMPLFFTRWITHLCAPTFFLLTGLGAALSRRRRTNHELSVHLISRGAWLIFLEIVVVRSLGLQFNFDYRVTVLNVLWALGWSMIALAFVIQLSPRSVLLLGAALILGHNLLDSISASSFGSLAFVWSWLHAPGVIVARPDFTVLLAYPLVPWVGVAMVGFGLSPIYEWDAARRRRMLWRTGAGLTAAFLLLRGINVYGDFSRWAPQAESWRTVLSFLNTTKYPPSLLFLLMTLGPALALLGWLDGRSPGLARPVWTFGKVPLFYFLVHLPVIHLLAILVCFLRYGSAHWMFESPDLTHFPFTQPPGWGFDLPGVYVAWFAVVLLMYPLCRWYAAYKRERRYWWLSYL
ncbi:MAG: heparan-alpha-glucosaminide N-acetyltransferase domain-containing protein [Gemmatimonadota bacterium]